MPYCTNCGSPVGANNFYCPNCGTRQPGATRSSFGQSPQTDFLGSISDRTASVLCYIPVFGVIAAIVFLASQRFRHNIRVRFDGFQSVYLFVTWLIASSALPTLLYTGYPPHIWFAGAFLGLIKAAVFVCWVYLLIKAAQQQQVHLPIIGDLAARSATEQL